jgi:hypothetical protein
MTLLMLMDIICIYMWRDTYIGQGGWVCQNSRIGVGWLFLCLVACIPWHRWLVYSLLVYTWLVPLERAAKRFLIAHEISAMKIHEQTVLRIQSILKHAFPLLCPNTWPGSETPPGTAAGLKSVKETVG